MFPLLPATLAFSHPWLLLALAALPVAWLVLRATPPPARMVVFPPLMLLRGLADGKRRTRYRHPWLTAIRLLVLTALILALAGPQLVPPEDEHDPSLPGALKTDIQKDDAAFLLVFDNGWDAAAGFHPRMRFALERLRLREKDESDARNIRLLTTAPQPPTATLAVSEAMTAAAAARRLAQLKPQAWEADYEAAAAALDAMPATLPLQALWVTGQRKVNGKKTFAEALAQRATLDIHLAEDMSSLYVLAPPQGDGGEAARLYVAPGASRRHVIHFRNKAGRVTGRTETVTDASGTGVVDDSGLAARNGEGVASLEVEGATGAAALRLLDDTFSRPLLALLVPEDDEATPPLLSEIHYLTKATAFGRLRSVSVMSIDRADAGGARLALLPDATALNADRRRRLKRWVEEEGGHLVRFAGARLAAALEEGRNPSLTPAPLRLLRQGGALARGGKEALSLAPFSRQSPLTGLAPDSSLTFLPRIVTAGPGDGVEIWARLSDGTPFISSRASGRGRITLFHTTANAAWSDFALSALFAGVLRRLAAAGAHSPKPSPPSGNDAGRFAKSGNDRRNPGDVNHLSARLLIDGFGHREAPQKTIRLPLEGWGRESPGALRPPGLYANAFFSRALNAGDSLAPLQVMEAWPATAALRYGLDVAAQTARLLAPWLVLAGLALLAVEALLCRALRRGTRLSSGSAPYAKRRQTAAFLISVPWLSLLPFLIFPVSAHALGNRIGYIETGDAGVDAGSFLALKNLSRVVGKRTTAVLEAPVAVAATDDDALALLTLLWWPLGAKGAGAETNEATAVKLKAYLAGGGLLVLDLAASGDAHPESLSRLAESLGLPPLAPLDDTHALARSFYLLARTAAFDFTSAWVARESAHSFSSVIVTTGNWRALWRREDNAPSGFDTFSHRFFSTPASAEEAAWRFGVNLVIYALTGDYKLDQVHAPALLKRLSPRR